MESTNSPVPPTSFEPMPQVQPQALPGFVSLFSEAFEIYKRYFWYFIKIGLWTIALSLIIVIPLVAVGAIIFFIFGINFTAENILIGGWIAGLLAIIPLIYVNIWGQVALIVAVKERSQVFGIKELYQMSRQHIRPYFWTSFLSGILIVVGFLFLIIPGVFLVVAWSFATYIVVDKGLEGMKAMKTSREYVKGFWGKLFGIYFLVLLLFIVFTYWPSIIFNKDVAEPISSIISFVLSPLLIVYTYLVYEKIKAIKPEVAQ